MIKEQFFPTIIYGNDIQLDNNFLANEIVNWSKQNKGIQKTNINGWHSETNMHELPQFKPLVDELFKMVVIISLTYILIVYLVVYIMCMHNLIQENLFVMIQDQEYKLLCQ